MFTVLKYIALVGTFFIYTTSGVFSKLASQRDFLSLEYIAFLGCTMGVLGVYAILWQQIIKRMDITLPTCSKAQASSSDLRLPISSLEKQLPRRTSSGQSSSSAALRCTRGHDVLRARTFQRLCRSGGPDAPEEGCHHAAQIIYQGIPEPVGYWRVLADGILAGIERVCAEPGRAAQGTRHHRGGQLPVRAGSGIRLFQGKNQPAQSCGNRAYLSGRSRVLLGVISKTSIIYSSFIVTKFLN